MISKVRTVPPEPRAPEEKPILFSADMVRALLAGTKTETRRLPRWPGKRAPRDDEIDNLGDCESVVVRGRHYVKCPYGGEGDRLWVRETWAEVYDAGEGHVTVLPPTSPETRAALRKVIFRATSNPPANAALRWKPGIHLRRSDARIILDVTAYPDLERLQMITEAAAIAEGVASIEVEAGTLYRDYLAPEPECEEYTLADPRESYRTLFDSINGRGSWAKNPFVWVVHFKLRA